MLAASSPFALFDDNLDNRGDLLLTDLSGCIVCTTPADLPAAFRAIEAAHAGGAWVALAARYELGYALEPRLAARMPSPPSALLTAWIFRCGRHQSSDETEAWLGRRLAPLSARARTAGLGGLTRSLTKEAYCSRVERIRALIDAGDCYQVNLTFSLDGVAYGEPLALYQRLRSAQPVRYGAFIAHDAGAILSRSPELFVERRGTTLTCRPMKGTAPRDTDPAALANSEKNRAENVMIVDLIRNDLGRLALSGGVRVERLCEVEPYRSVWQMTSTVVAEPVTAGLSDIFAALFPCGSVTGAPKIRAMEIIEELEDAPRGIYCGALGWIAPGGDFRFNVPIRTLEVGADRSARLGIGSGIVADSDPDGEWEECLLKGRFISALPPSFGLIETLRCEPHEPEPYPLLDLHLERLADSARFFGFAFDEAKVRAVLEGETARLREAHRVRLVLDASGQPQITSTPLEPSAPEARPTVVVSPLRISRSDPLQRHKTTERERYDQELARVTGGGHFDALFFNEDEELVEGARTNVFLDLGDGVLLTPPLDSGALNGVYRRKLLEEGRAREARLTASELARAQRIYLTNAVRGMMRVYLVV